MAKEFSCEAAGASCGWKTTAETDEELLKEVSEHLKTKHNVEHVTKTLANYALKVAKER